MTGFTVVTIMEQCPACDHVFDSTYVEHTLTQRAEAAEARAAELAAQLATAQDAIERVKKERDEAKKVCDYWLHHARFLADDYHKDSEYNLAVESLKAYKLQEGIEP